MSDYLIENQLIGRRRWNLLAGLNRLTRRVWLWKRSVPTHVEGLSDRDLADLNLRRATIAPRDFREPRMF